MANVGIGFGIILILLGGGAYLATGSQSVTALIPAFLGVPMTLLGVLARDERRLKVTMHVSVLLALIGLAGSARGVPGTLALLAGQQIERPAAAVVQTAMAVLCAVFLGLAIKSFVDARRSRAT